MMIPVVRVCVTNLLFCLAGLLVLQMQRYTRWIEMNWSAGTRSPSLPPQGLVNNRVKDDDGHTWVNSRLPHDLRLVFVGDSVTRYQYLSLAYYLRYGRWWDGPRDGPNNLMNAHSFRHPAHPNDDWNEFFLQSNRLLYPFEACDCRRSPNSSDTVLERRYFHDTERNNTLVYINLNGNETHGSWGYYGRFNADTIFPNFHQWVHVPVGFGRISKSIQAVATSFGEDRMRQGGNATSSSTTRFTWEYSTWGEVLEYHVGRLGLGAGTTVILNAGLHRHDFSGGDPKATLARRGIRDALEKLGMTGIWKTTTYTATQLIQGGGDAHRKRKPYHRVTDHRMCQLLGHCLNVSWTMFLKSELYFDDLHFVEPVYRVFNEELLDRLDALSNDYVRFNRTTLLSNVDPEV